MAYEILFVFSLMGFHSAMGLHSASRGETEIKLDLSNNFTNCKKCPAGFSSFCPQNEESRCVKCVEGTYSEHTSRRQACKRCSDCGYNKFEVLPCTPTSNVKCKECSKCPPGFGVLKPCGKTRDTVCGKCPVVKEGMISYHDKDCSQGGREDHLVYKKSKEKEKPKDGLTVTGVENPWADGRKNPKFQHKLTVIEKYANVNVFVPEFPSVNPTPSSLFLSTKQSDTEAQGTVFASSVVYSSPSFSRRPSMAISPVAGKAIGPSLRPTIPAQHRPPPGLERARQTEKTVYHDVTFEKPTNYGMQGDDGSIPGRTPRSIGQNSTDTVTKSGTSLSSPSKRVNAKNIHRGMDEEHSTKFPPHHTLGSGNPFDKGTIMATGNNMEIEVEMPAPTNRDRAELHFGHRQDMFPHSQHWLWIVVGVAVVAVLVLFIAVKRWKHLQTTTGCLFTCPRPKCRLSRCMAPSDCCDSTSISSAAGACAEQGGSPVRVSIQVPETDDSLPNSNNPTLHTYLPSESTIVAADVHHNTVFDVFGVIRSLRYITQAEATFNNSGGKLSAPDSDVTITVDSGAVPEGINQRFFFRVVHDETSLLRDIPETPERTLISPVIECGPHDINLLKPVEIIVPHCLYFDEVKKESITVCRCEHYSDKGTLKWEKVPSASEKNCQSKAWFTVKKNSIHIKTKTFSFWSIFACGGPKRKRATVYFSRHNTRSDLIYLRFYIYSDNEDSKKRVKAQEKEFFPGSTQSKEKPFKMYSDDKDITVQLTDLEEGWELDKTPNIQTYNYETAYRNGFRSKDSCDFAVKPTRPGVKEFRCIVKFKQGDSPTEQSIYLNPGYTPRQTIRRFSVESSGSGTYPSSTGATGAPSITVVPEENEDDDSQDTITSPDSPANETNSSSSSFCSLGSDEEPVTDEQLYCIREEIGMKWKDVLRKLGLKEPMIENISVNHKEYGVEEMCYQGLLEWKKRFSEEATTKKLCEVLDELRCSEALKMLSKEGVMRDAAAPIQESSDNHGTNV